MREFIGKLVAHFIEKRRVIYYAFAGLMAAAAAGLSMGYDDVRKAVCAIESAAPAQVEAEKKAE